MTAPRFELTSQRQMVSKPKSQDIRNQTKSNRQYVEVGIQSATLILCTLPSLQDDGRVVTLLGRFSWQDADEKALVKLIATPLSLSGKTPININIISLI